MLDIALDVRPAFERMAAEEMNKYRSYFDEEDEQDEEEEQEYVLVTPRTKKTRVGPPADEDWEKAR